MADGDESRGSKRRRSPSSTQLPSESTNTSAQWSHHCDTPSHVLDSKAISTLAAARLLPLGGALLNTPTCASTIARHAVAVIIRRVKYAGSSQPAITPSQLFELSKAAAEWQASTAAENENVQTNAEGSVTAANQFLRLSEEMICCAFRTQAIYDIDGDKKTSVAALSPTFVDLIERLWGAQLYMQLKPSCRIRLWTLIPRIFDDAVAAFLKMTMIPDNTEHICLYGIDDILTKYGFMEAIELSPNLQSCFSQTMRTLLKQTDDSWNVLRVIQRCIHYTTKSSNSSRIIGLFRYCHHEVLNGFACLEPPVVTGDGSSHNAIYEFEKIAGAMIKNVDVGYHIKLNDLRYFFLERHLWLEMLAFALTSRKCTRPDFPNTYILCDWVFVGQNSSTSKLLQKLRASPEEFLTDILNENVLSQNPDEASCYSNEFFWCCLTMSVLKHHVSTTSTVPAIVSRVMATLKAIPSLKIVVEDFLSNKTVHQPICDTFL